MLTYIVLSVVLTVAISNYAKRLVDVRPAVRIGSIASVFVAAALSFWYITDVLQFAHDARRYDREATFHYEAWKGGFEYQVLGGNWFGGGMVDLILGWVYRLTGPNLLLGFGVFAAFSAIGRLWLIDGMRRLLPNMRQEASMLLLFLLPSASFFVVFTGKEALMTFGVGGVYRVVLAQSDHFRKALIGAAPIVAFALIRPHMLIVAVASAIAFRAYMEARDSGGITPVQRIARQYIGGAAALGAVVAAWTVNASRLGLSLDLNEATEAVRGFTDRTTAGSSVFSPPNVFSPIGFVEATINVLGRPFIWGASSVRQLAAAIESPIWLVLVTAGMLALFRIDRRLFAAALFALILDIIILGSIANEGLLVRQRSLVLPLLVLCLNAILIRRANLSEAASLRLEETQPRTIRGRQLGAASSN